MDRALQSQHSTDLCSKYAMPNDARFLAPHDQQYQQPCYPHCAAIPRRCSWPTLCGCQHFIHFFIFFIHFSILFIIFVHLITSNTESTVHQSVAQSVATFSFTSSYIFIHYHIILFVFAYLLYVFVYIS